MGYSMRTGRYRFTRWQNAKGEVLAVELYDYHDDPFESVNIAVRPANAQLIARLSRQLDAGWRAAGPPAAQSTTAGAAQH